MKGIKLSKKVFGGIILLLLVGIVLGYFMSHRERKRIVDPIEKKHPGIDSVTHFKREMTPAEMGSKPKVDPKDGSVKIVEEFVKLNAKNPATFEFLEWSEVLTEDGYWKVRCKYTGISSFNAEVTTNAWFYIRKNKVVYTKIISKI